MIPVTITIRDSADLDNLLSELGICLDYLSSTDGTRDLRRRLKYYQGILYDARSKQLPLPLGVKNGRQE